MNWKALNTVCVELGLHSHHNVVELAIVYIATSWPTECLAAHSSSDHLDRNERWALERRTATEVDDVLTTLDYALTECIPISERHTLGADDVGEWSAINGSGRCKYCHLLAVTTVSTRVNNLVSRNLEVLCQLRTKTSRIESSQSSNLRWLNTCVDQSDETGDVSRVEDNNDVLYIWAVLLNVLTELGSDLCVALEQILTGHTCLTSSATRRYYILRIGQCLLDVRGESEVDAVETAVEQLLCYTLQCWSEWVVKADVRRKFHHHSTLCHVRTDHTGCADDGQFLVSKKTHNCLVFKSD